MATLSTLGGWAAVIAIIGGYWYYNTNQSKNRRIQPVKAALKPTEFRSPKLKNSKRDGSLSSGDHEAKPSAKKQRKPQTVKAERAESIPIAQDSTVHEKEDEMDNKEFARQLENLRTGTVMAPKSQAATKQRSVKQSRAQEKLPAETSSDNATAPSSATGGDADDDQSPMNSPELTATTTSPAQNGDVSDMLERPASGPSVLKITEPTNSSRPKKPRPAPTFEAAETKKQRQNKKKAEAKKAARAEDEKERQVAMEEQRRAARIAEGRAAKDGSTFMAAKAPPQSAWVASTTNGAAGKEVNDSNVDLLDTCEPSTQASIPPVGKVVTTVPAEALYSEGEMAGSDWQHNFSSLPSEEEQTRLALEESDNWNTVKTKERRKRDKPIPQEKQSSSDERTNYDVPPVIAPTTHEKKWPTTGAQAELPGEIVEQEKEEQDSEWEVA